MDARWWVVSTLDALRLEWPNLSPVRQRALWREVVALLDALDRCHMPDDWERLRQDLQSFGTRHELRDLLSTGVLSGDEALDVSYRGNTRAWGHGALQHGRSAFEMSRLFRRLLGRQKPAPIETYPEVDAPEEVVERTSFRVEVTSRWQPTALAGRKIALPRAGEGPVDLEVELELPWDGALTASCQLVQPLRIPESHDSPTLGFALFAERPGPARYVVRFRQGGVERLVVPQSVLVRSVTQHLATATSGARSRSSGTLRAGAERFIGLRLRVDERSRDTTWSHVRVILDGPRSVLREPVEGSRELPIDAPALLVKLCRELHDDLTLAEAEARELRIQSIGIELARTLLPQHIIQALASVPAGTALHIEAEDPWVPWEMASLGAAGFLGERFAVTRWLRSGSSWECLAGGRAVFVAPPSNPPLQVNDERTALRMVSGDAAIEYRTVLETMKAIGSTNAIGFLHFACHGRAEPATPLGGRLVLDGGELRPVDVQASDALAGACVFINACEAGIHERMLSGHGGWADAFLLRAAAGAFVAPSWSVGDRVASIFARQFYQHLGTGQTVGEAARLARTQARDGVGPDDPDRLAYAVYALPTARLATDEDAP